MMENDSKPPNRPSRPLGLAGRIAHSFINSKLTPLVIVAALLFHQSRVKLHRFFEIGRSQIILLGLLEAAAALGQLYQWPPGLKRSREGPRGRGGFDVQAVFNALNKR